jgi:hypothetical protein
LAVPAALVGQGASGVRAVPAALAVLAALVGQGASAVLAVPAASAVLADQGASGVRAVPGASAALAVQGVSAVQGDPAAPKRPTVLPIARPIVQRPARAAAPVLPRGPLADLPRGRA